MKLSRESVLSVLGRSYTGHLSLHDLSQFLSVKRQDRTALRTLLSDLVDAGDIEKVGRGGYRLAEPGGGGRVSGRIRIHPAGYGFVEREDMVETVFVPAKYRSSALDGDRVELTVWDGLKGTEGRVEKVLQRGRAKLTGVIGTTGLAIYLEPDDPRIASDYGRVFLEEGAQFGRVGDSAVIEISEYPTDKKPRIVGRLLKVLGPPDDPATEIAKIIACADIPEEFPDDARAQAEATPQEVTETDLVDRIDLRDREFLTIDPETARDFDDALCIEDGPYGGPRVWIAVADVSHYVQPDDALDREAQLRGVSVYLPDQVVPMLPFELSSAICSLNPGVDRCAMVVRLDFDDKLEVVDKGYAAAVIRSRARLDYPGVAAALSGDFRGRRELYRKWAANLERMHALAMTLRERRRKRGTLEIDIPEPKVVLDADDPRLVREIVKAKDTEAVRSAYQLVEEFMIAANEAVGSFFASRELDTLWRVHARPTVERVEELAAILESFGVDVDVEEARTPLGMRKVLAAIEDKPAVHALSFMVLRSLTQAAYELINIGHFGLASEEYLHFTSPIRRYPDLIVHRLLKYHLHREGQAAGGGGANPPPSHEDLAVMAADSSSHERRAIEAEREAVAMYRAYFMRDHIGETFVGRVSGVQSFGVFVEIDSPFVEGMIKISELGDERWDYDEAHMRVAGRKTGRSLAIGDTVRVELVDVSVARRRIELRLAETLTSEGTQATRRRRAGQDGRSDRRASGGAKGARGSSNRTTGKGKSRTAGKGKSTSKSKAAAPKKATSRRGRGRGPRR